jgi:hypothetical protein
MTDDKKKRCTACEEIFSLHGFIIPFSGLFIKLCQERQSARKDYLYKQTPPDEYVK